MKHEVTFMQILTIFLLTENASVHSDGYHVSWLELPNPSVYNLTWEWHSTSNCDVISIIFVIFVIFESEDTKISQSVNTS